MKPEYRVYNFNTFVNVTVLINHCGNTPHGTESEWIEYAKHIHDEYNLVTHLYTEFKDKETGFIKSKLICTI